MMYSASGLTKVSLYYIATRYVSIFDQHKMAPNFLFFNYYFFNQPGLYGFIKCFVPWYRII